MARERVKRRRLDRAQQGAPRNHPLPRKEARQGPRRAHLQDKRLHLAAIRSLLGNPLLLRFRLRFALSCQLARFRREKHHRFKGPTPKNPKRTRECGPFGLAHRGARASPMRAASGCPPPAVPYHTPIRARLATPGRSLLPVTRNILPTNRYPTCRAAFRRLKGHDSALAEGRLAASFDNSVATTGARPSPRAAAPFRPSALGKPQRHEPGIRPIRTSSLLP